MPHKDCCHIGSLACCIPKIRALHRSNSQDTRDWCLVTLARNKCVSVNGRWWRLIFIRFFATHSDSTLYIAALSNSTSIKTWIKDREVTRQTSKRSHPGLKRFKDHFSNEFLSISAIKKPSSIWSFGLLNSNQRTHSSSVQIDLFRINQIWLLTIQNSKTKLQLVQLSLSWQLQNRNWNSVRVVSWPEVC